MQEIISQLTEIEKTANSIVEEANNKKAEIFDEMEEKKKEYDLKLQKETENKIQLMNAELEKKRTDDIERLKQSTEQDIKEKQDIYDNRHTAISQSIFKRIVGEG
ncbi:MAG: hypothetical protein GX567_07355 [Clostridia bacterium]|nr:hypothetical protein [Clostridia bacterium]